MIKLLIGGSPCTYWSIAQSIEKREGESIKQIKGEQMSLFGTQ